MGIRVKYDNADNKRPGFKFADYELKGVPVRVVMGGRDLETAPLKSCVVTRSKRKPFLMKALKTT